MQRRFSAAQARVRLSLGIALAVGIAATRGAPVVHNVEYGRAAGVPLLLDVSTPAGAGPFPVAILVHGGGWSAGDKAGSNHPGDSADISPWFSILDRAGFTWFSINYRMAPQYRWPACAEDVDTAIRWVKTHAAEYRGDPRRIVLFGHSAGGQLVCYAATHATADTRVQAVVAFAPVTDLVADSERRGGLSSSLQRLFGLPPALTPRAKAILRQASPIDAVKPGLPPFLILQGTADRTVPPAMTAAFQAKLRAAGDDCDRLLIPGAPHGLLPWDHFDPNYRRELTSRLADLLRGASPR